MKNKLLLIFMVLLTLLNIAPSYSQVINTESFDATTFPPSNWRIAPPFAGTAVNQGWRRQANGTNPTQTPNSGTGQLRFASRNFAANTIQYFVTPVIDYSNLGTNTATVDFYFFRDNFSTNADSVTFWVNTVDTVAGATRIGAVARDMTIGLPNTEVAQGWYHYTFNVPTTFNTATNYIILQGTSQSPVAGQGSNCFIDDFTWTSFPPACSGVPNVGTMVASTDVICGGTGSSNLSVSNPITGVSGITYNWEQAGVVTGPWLSIGNASTVNTGVINFTTYYQCTVACAGSGLTYTTPVDSVVVSTNPLPVLTATPAFTSFCAGSNGAPIKVTGAATYTWNPATNITFITLNGDSVLAAPTNNTNYTITGADAFGCTGTTNVQVQVSNPPTTVITAVKDTICLGETIILTGPNGGGGPGGGQLSYLWSDGTTTRRDTISPTVTTSYILAATSINSGCTGYDTLTITVLQQTGPVMTLTPNSASICDGNGPVTLTASGPTSITWSPATGLDTINGGTVQAFPNNTTVYTVTGSNGGLCTATLQITVGVGNSPIATIFNLIPGIDSVCAGDSVVLRAGPGGGFNPNSYLWSDGTNTRNDTIIASATTTYTVDVTSSIGCVGQTTYTLTVLPASVANFGFTTNGNTVTFSDSSLNATGWLWNFGDAGSSSTSTLQNPVYTYPNDTVYTASLVVFNTGCGNDTFNVTIDLKNVGINNIELPNIHSVYPNPAQNEITISGAKIEDNSFIAFTNTLGQVFNLNIKGNKVVICTLPNGVYNVSLSKISKKSIGTIIKN
jgi:hypothetical protein